MNKNGNADDHVKVECSFNINVVIVTVLLW